MNTGTIVGIDIGGTNIRIGALDSEWKLTEFRKVERKKILYGEHVAQKLLNFIGEYLREHLPDRRVTAVAAGFPATLNKERTRLLSTPNIEGLDNVEIASILTEGLGIPVYIERDVSMLFYYDRHRYSLPQTGIVIACYIGTGIGNVISIDGELLTGADGVAGELGHIPMLGKSERCGCGNAGCIENYGSGRYLEKLAAQRFPKVPIRQIFAQKAQDPAVREFIDYVSIPIAAEINILNPETVILGGGVLSMESFPKELLETCIRMHARKPLPERNLRTLYSAEGDTNGVIGAALYAAARLHAKETVK